MNWKTINHFLNLFEQLHDETITVQPPLVDKHGAIHFHNKNLNESQQQAVAAIIQNEQHHYCSWATRHR